MLGKSSIWRSLTYPRSTQGKIWLRAFSPKTELCLIIDSVKFITNALKKIGHVQLGSLLHILMTNVSSIALCLSSLLEWSVAREEVGQRGRAVAGSAYMSFSHFQSKTGERAIGATTQSTFLLSFKNLTV